jgi:hypothetical protein
LMNWPPPSTLSQWSLSQHFSIRLVYSQKDETNSFCSSTPDLLSAPWSGWFRPGQAPGAVHGDCKQSVYALPPCSLSYFLSLASSSYFSLSFLFLIFLCLCSGIDIWLQCHSEPKNFCLWLK